MSKIRPVTAEELPYWKTSQSGPDAWLDKAEALIVGYGGTITARATIREMNREAVMLAFTIGGEPFQVAWPVLESRDGNVSAARRQAATMLYHDIKSRAVRLRVFGARVAFFDSLKLPDGRTTTQLALPELAAAMPKMLTAWSAP